MALSDVSFVCVDDTKTFLARVEEVANNGQFSSQPTPTLIRNLAGLDDFILRVNSGAVATPQFMIVDISLDEPSDGATDLDGITALKRIRKSHALKNCPVIIHSQYLDDDTINQSYLLSANSVVEKPHFIQEQKIILEEIIRYWLERNQK